MEKVMEKKDAFNQNHMMNSLILNAYKIPVTYRQLKN